jgi:hypothetical protein
VEKMLRYEKLIEVNTIFDICKLFYHEYSKNKSARNWPKSPENLLYERKIILFGAGGFGKKIIENLNSKGLSVSYICDNDNKKWGQFIDKIEINSPDRLGSEDKSAAIVVISSMYHEQIAAQLDTTGIDYVYSTIDGEYRYLPRNSDKIWNMLELYWSSREKIDEVHSMLSDDVSKKAYMNVLKAKIIESSIPYNAYYRGLLGSIYEGEQYFDRKHFKYYDNDVFVDCGAYMGDTILELFNLGIYEYKEKNSPFIYAFEPDIINFNILNELLRSNNYDNYVKTILSGIGNSKSTLGPKDIINCRRDGIANDIDVPIVRIDDALSGIPVTFI